MQNGRIGGATLYENIWQIHLLCAVSCWWPSTNRRSTTRSRSLLLSEKKNNNLRWPRNVSSQTQTHPVCRIRSKIKRSLPGWMLSDWTIVPKSGCHTQEYSTVTGGLWRKTDPARYRTAKISFQGWQNSTSVCNPAARGDDADHSLSSLSLSPSLFSWASVLALRASIPPWKTDTPLGGWSYNSDHRVATLCLPRPPLGWRREALCQEGWTESRLFSNWQKKRTDLWGEKGDTNTGKYKETQGGCEKNERRLHNGGKGALCSLVTAEKDLQGLFFFLCLNKLNEQSLFVFMTDWTE